MARGSGQPGYYESIGFLPASPFGLIDPYCFSVVFQTIVLVTGVIPVPVYLVHYAREKPLMA